MESEEFIRWGEWQRTMRSERGWTQFDLVKASGVPQSDLSRYETGAQAPSFETMVRIARAFNENPPLALMGRYLASSSLMAVEQAISSLRVAV